MGRIRIANPEEFEDIIKISERYGLDTEYHINENELPKLTEEEYKMWYENSFIGNSGNRIGYEVIMLNNEETEN